MKYLLIVVMLAGMMMEQIGNDHYVIVFNDNVPTLQNVGDSYQNATDNTWHLWNGYKWLKCTD